MSASHTSFFSSNGEDFLNDSRDDDHFDNTGNGGLSMDINDSIGNGNVITNPGTSPQDAGFEYDYDGYYYFQNDTQYYVLVAVGLTSCFLSICGSCIILYLILLNKYQNYKTRRKHQQQGRQKKQRLQRVLCLLKVLFLRGRHNVQKVQQQQQEQRQEDGDGDGERMEGQQHQRQQQSSQEDLKQAHARQTHAQPQPAQQLLTSQPSQAIASSNRQLVGSPSMKGTKTRIRRRHNTTTTIRTKTTNSTSNKNELLYHRLVMGLSFSDCIVSISLFLQAFFFPSTAQFPLTITNSSSTTSTTSGCNTILGFFYPFFISSYCYNCSLGVYFMLMVKYNWKQQQISRIMEPYVHILAFGVPFIYSSVCTYYKLFHMNPYLGICSPIPYPINCTYSEDDDMECYNNSEKAIPIVMIHDGIALVYFVTGLICTSIVYCTIRKTRKIRLQKQLKQQQQQQKTQEQQQQQQQPDPQQSDVVDDDVEEQEEEGESFRRRMRQQRLLELQLEQRQKQREYYQHSIGIQAIYYACAYMIGFVCFVIVEILKGIFAPKIKVYGIQVLGEEPSYYVAMLLIWMFFPIQGFFNCIIFIRPRYQKWIQYYYLHEDTIRIRRSCGNAQQQLDDEGDEEGRRPYLSSSSSSSSCRCCCSFSYGSIWAFRMVLSGMPVPKSNDYSSSSVSKNKLIKENLLPLRCQSRASSNRNHGATPSREDFSNNNNSESHNSKKLAALSRSRSSSFSDDGSAVNNAAYDGVDDDLDMIMVGGSPILADSMLLYDSILLGGGGGEHEGEETERNYDDDDDDNSSLNDNDNNNNNNPNNDECETGNDYDHDANAPGRRRRRRRRRQIIPESTSDDDDYDDVETYEPLKT